MTFPVTIVAFHSIYTFLPNFQTSRFSNYPFLTSSNLTTSLFRIGAPITNIIIKNMGPVQSGRSWVKLDGPNDWNWAVMNQTGRFKRLKWTVCESGRSWNPNVNRQKGENWTLQKIKTQPPQWKWPSTFLDSVMFDYLKRNSSEAYSKNNALT